MKFGSDDNADSSTVEDRRGMSGGRIGAASGGLGIAGLVIYLIVRALGGDIQTSDQSPENGPAQGNGPVPASRTETTSASLGGSCEGVTSSTDQAKFITCVETNVQSFWRGEMAKRQDNYDTSKLVLFTDRTQSGCGGADAAMGPFYCPRDRKVYLDLGFFNDLRTKLGAKGGDFAEAYVIAHEYGHHVQDVLGIERKTRAQMEQNPDEQNALSVRLELQADCFAGVWGHSAYGDGKVAASEISDAMDAAAAVGDDRIQKRARGSVNPDSFTHGSSADRQRWFNQGMTSGNLDACDTFSRR